MKSGQSKEEEKNSKRNANRPTGETKHKSFSQKNSAAPFREISLENLIASPAKVIGGIKGFFFFFFDFLPLQIKAAANMAKRPIIYRLQLLPLFSQHRGKKNSRKFQIVICCVYFFIDSKNRIRCINMNVRIRRNCFETGKKGQLVHSQI